MTLEDDPYNVDPERFDLSDALRRRLDEWQRRFDAQLNRDARLMVELILGRTDE